MMSAMLDRSIGLPQATAMVVGTIIGASIFVQPSEVSRSVPGFAAMLLVWLVAGALTWFGASICAELSSAFPVTGGVYVFLREMFSPAVGFLWGWAMFWSMHSGIIAAIAVVFGRYVTALVPMGTAGVQVAAIAAILVLTAINCLGVRPGSAVQTGLTVLKVVAVLALLTLLLGSSRARIPAAGEVPAFNAFLRAVGAGLFAFGGWHMVTYAADETRDPSRTIPRALMLGTAVVVAAYLGLSAAYLMVLPLDAVLGSTRVAADAASAVAGPTGAAAISFLVVVSSFGAMSGIILAGPRVYYAMAHDGLLFRWMGASHPRFRTPTAAILAQGAWASMLVLTGTYRALFTRVVYTEWIFFGALALGLLRLRSDAGYSPVFRAWGRSLAPLMFAAACLAIVVNQIAADPRESLTGLAIVVAGLPVYYAWKHLRPSGRD